MNMANFDRELSLDELVKGVALDRLLAALEMLAGVPLALEDEAGIRLAGRPEAQEKQCERVPIKLEIEPVGYMRAPAGEIRAGAAAASLMQSILQARAQVVRAGELHTEAMSSDYEQLRAQNEALRRSETQYRELSEELDARVKEQVKLLDERQRQLYQAERLASVGQLAAGVAHEINNPIGFIRSNLETGRSYLGKLRELKAALQNSPESDAVWQKLDLDFVIDDFGELLGDCITGADRVTRIVKDLKGFSNVDQPDEEDIDLNVQLASVVSVISGQKPAAISISENYQPLEKLLCLPGHLNQVFIAILTNALQALEGREQGGRVTVSTRQEEKTIIVEITDNGPGIAEANLSRVFDPFFTTRGVGRGTGLGLTVARDIVAVHGGTIELKTPPEGGTKVSIRLPL